jgi:hypothetical protein
MFSWDRLDTAERLFIIWSFVFQILLIVHFAIRKPLMDGYTQKFGWIIYALAIPAAVISIYILRAGKNWYFWIAGFIFVVYALFGFWVDYMAKIPFRNPLQLSVLLPYIFLYLATVMFYWWPLARLNRTLWFIYTILFIIASILNITSH